uniref:S-adenosyl-L-homocysteine hydrolase NAD binding domain-containing protein n=1 Tax=Bionectria ochroleuca TaxID=29856 RepID=A0A0B7KJC3_BIOOC
MKAPPRVVALVESLHPDAVKLAQELFTAPAYQLLLSPAQNWRESAHAIVMRTGSLTREDIEAAKCLQVVGKQGVGLDKVDLSAAKEQGVIIRNTPGINATAVAELVVAHIFAVARQIVDIGVRQRNGSVFQRHQCSGLQITGKTIGIVGMGAIGKTVARMLHHGFGCTIFAYDPFLADDAWSDVPHTRAQTVQEMLPLLDVLTLHVPLADGTRNLISMTEFKAMKQSCGVVNEEDMVTALKEKKIWGVGIDALVYDPPTLEKYGDLWSLPNVVTTPHIGASTPQTQSESACAAVLNVWEFFESNK